MKLLLIFLLIVNLDLDIQINDVYLPLLEDQTRDQIVFGGASGGKSLFLIGQRMIVDLLNGKRNYLAIRNVGNTLRGSIFNEAIQGINRLGVRDLFRINKTEMTITCRNGRQAILKGLDDVEKIKSIIPEKGVITDLLIEEATEIGQDDYKQLRRRLRGKSEVPKRVTLIFNPITKTHWIYNEYFAGRFSDSDREYRDENLLIFKTTYKDNLRFLEKDDIAELENETDEYYYDVYTLGNWGVLGNLVFTNWKVEDLSKRFNKFSYYFNGLDFGFTNDYTALARAALHRKEIYVINPLYELGLTNDVIAEKIRKVVRREPVYCDAAEPKSIAELRSHKINAHKAIKGPGSLNYGIQYLKQFTLIIDKHSQHAINELQQYHWEKNKEGEVLNIPVDKNNHFIDALRYAFSHRMRDSKAATTDLKEAGVYIP